MFFHFSRNNWTDVTYTAVRHVWRKIRYFVLFFYDLQNQFRLSRLWLLKCSTSSKADYNIRCSLTLSLPSWLFVCAHWCWLCVFTGAFTCSCMTAKVAPSNGTDGFCHLPSGHFPHSLLSSLIFKVFLICSLFPQVEIWQNSTKLGIRD